jgi:hypothetical protein
MIATDTISALCHALDEGDDSALLPLADALEEAGDPQAAGLLAPAPRGDRNTGPPRWRPPGRGWSDMS